MMKPGCQSTFPPSTFTRSLAFEFLRAAGTALYSVLMWYMAIKYELYILSLVIAQILAMNLTLRN